jgi:hypothetical protein
MVEKAPHAAARPYGPTLLQAVGPATGPVYAITALRYNGTQVSEAMLGLIDQALERWDLPPTPTRLVEVVDRLVEGDTVITLFRDEQGRMQAGPQVKVDVLPEGTETLALAQDVAGRRLADLPRF